MGDYNQDMRKLVGHKTLIQCAASIIIIDEENRVLLGRRTDNHKWCYSGGAIEIDETVEDCAKRELYEEMGFQQRNWSFSALIPVRKRIIFILTGMRFPMWRLSTLAGSGMGKCAGRQKKLRSCGFSALTKLT